VRIKFNHQTVSYSRRVLPACACSYLHDSIRASLPCGNGNANVNSCCRGDQYSSAEADTGATPAATSALTKPHDHAYADSYADGNTNADSISHSYSHNSANGHTGTSSSSTGDLYWK
jgi:hypothetical protein